jgi:hypothetical protein
LATDESYQKQGLGSRILEWGCDEADREELEFYLDAEKSAQPLNERFGFVEQSASRDLKAMSVLMLRPAKKGAQGPK